MIVFDIETGPLPDGELFALVDPFESPTHPGAFDESAVAVNHLRDPVKIAAKIETAKAAHEANVTNYEQNVKAARENWIANTRKQACLDARLGQVLAIGIRDTSSGKASLGYQGDEKLRTEEELIAWLWAVYKAARAKQIKMVGHYCLGFDLPFLLRRSFILGVDVPATVLDDRCYFDSRTFVDTHKIWTCGTRDGNASLDAICRAMALPTKPADTVEIHGETVPVDGANFWRLFHGGDEARAAAFEYLANDLEMTAGVAGRMGIL